MSRKEIKPAVMLFLLLLTAGAATAGAPVSIPLTVQEPSGVDRAAGPVTSGVPLPKGAVKDAAELVLMNETTRKPVPCQFTVQSRWPGSSVKWVLLDFLCGVKAGGRVEYSLRNGSGNPAPATAASARDAEDHVVLTSGPLVITISKTRGTIMEEARLNDSPILSADKPCEAVLQLDDDKLYRTDLGKPSLVQIEDGGPVRACVLVRGSFVDEAGKGIYDGKVGYDARVTVWAGKPHAKVDFTLRNDASYGFKAIPKRAQWINFKSVRLDLPLAAGGEAVETDFHCSDGIHPLPPEKEVTLTQWFKYPRMNPHIGEKYASSETDKQREARANMAGKTFGYYYLVESGDEVKSPGANAEGWAGVYRGGAPFVHAHVRRFRQNFPSGFAVTRERLSLLLIPRGGFWPRTEEAGKKGAYQFEGNRHKTWEVLFRFGRKYREQAAEHKAFEQPLFAKAPIEYYRVDDAVWPLARTDISVKDPETLEAVKRYELLQKAKVHQSMGDNAKISDPNAKPRVWDRWRKVSIPGLQERCPDGMCGFMNFGDLMWSFGYCSLFYDWPYAMAIQYLRSGDRAMLDVCRDMTAHRYDVDRGPGFQMYEKGHHGNYSRKDVRKRYAGEFRPRGSHSWGRGLLLYWALTGDRGALDAAQRNGRAYEGAWQKDLGKELIDAREYRTPGWTIEQWLALYEYTGEAKYLELADTLFTKSLLAMEKSRGSCGHILPEGKQTAQFTSFIIEPVARLHRVTGRKDAAEFLKRVLDWHRKAGMLDGKMIGDKYAPLKFLDNWEYAEAPPEDRSALAAGRLYAFFMTDGFAYLHQVFQRKEDLALARRLFRESMFYYGVEGNEVDPKARTPLGYHFRGEVVNSAAKVHAWTGRYHQIYLLGEEMSAKKEH